MTKPASQSDEKKRKRRIASDEAHAWARNLKLRNSLAKLVLCMLTGYVDGDGICFVGIEALGDDTELSSDTVRKRLAWLEGVGAIARFPQWIDANGRRNGEGKGRRTSDEIRLLLDADPASIEARAAGEEVETDDADPCSAGPLPQRGSEHPDEPAGPAVAPQLAPERPSDSRKGHNEPEPYPEPEDSPPSVPHGGGGGDDVDVDQESEGGPLTGWIEFKQAYEADGDVIVKTSLPMTLFQAVPIEQRPLLIKAARGLIYERKLSKTTRPKPSPQTVIRETESWESLASKAPPREGEDFHRVPVDSRDGKAFRVLSRAAGAVEPREFSGFYSIRPRALNAAELAFADAPSHHEWKLVTEGPQIAAWLGFFAKTVQLGARKEIVRYHKVGDEQVRGFNAPWPWPPTKDGKTIPWPQQTGDPKSNAA